MAGILLSVSCIAFIKTLLNQVKEYDITRLRKMMKLGHLAAMAFWGLGVVVAVASMVLLPGGIPAGMLLCYCFPWGSWL